MALRELHHQTALRHSDLQRRFLFGLTIAAGVFFSSLRAEVPNWALLLAIPPLAWAYAEARGIKRLSVDAEVQAFFIIDGIDEGGEELSQAKENGP